MPTEITMPRLSDQMEEATILQWTKAEGDDVAKGDPIAEIETDKATWQIEAEASGTLLKIAVHAGEAAPVGGIIGFIGERGEALPDAPLEVPMFDASADLDVDRSIVTAENEPAVAPPQAPSSDSGRVRATPVARRTAFELGIAIDQVVATGPGGRITRKNVLSAAAARTSAPAPSFRTYDRGAGVVAQLTPTQRTMARRMLEAAAIPTFVVDAEIDMEAVLALRAEFKELASDAVTVPSLNDFVVKAVALTLREQPLLNASYEGDNVVRWPRINVGIAIATAHALLVPAVFDVDEKPLAQIARETRDLVHRANTRALTALEVSGGTFTVSNLGMFGVPTFTAMINPPQAAILAVGEVARKAVVDPNGALVVRQRMDVRLSCDHRIVTGADAARFLTRVRELIERPLSLTL